MSNDTRTCLDCERTDLHGFWCCQPHYRKRLALGTLPPRPTEQERFESHFERTADCWGWQSTTRKGYGRFMSAAGVWFTAHRFAYELAVAPIAPGMTIDHLCRNTLCVNPAHLEQVTLLENIRRRPPTLKHRNAVKTHCVNGHSFDVYKYLPDGRLRRRCSICDRARELMRAPRRQGSTCPH